MYQLRMTNGKQSEPVGNQHKTVESAIYIARLNAKRLPNTVWTITRISDGVVIAQSKATE